MLFTNRSKSRSRITPKQQHSVERWTETLEHMLCGVVVPSLWSDGDPEEIAEAYELSAVIGELIETGRDIADGQISDRDVENFREDYRYALEWFEDFQSERGRRLS